MIQLNPGDRVGVIAEGEHDLKVLADWARRLLRPDLQFLAADQRRLGRKPELLRKAPEVCGVLLDDGCALVVVAWDIAAFNGPELSKEEELDRFWLECDAEDELRHERGEHPLVRDRVCPVVVTAELETWLIADERALSAFLSTAAHPIAVSPIKRPEREENPKAVLKKLFKSNGKLAYVDYLHAVPIGARVPDLARLGNALRVPSFQDFMANLGAI